MLDIWRRQSSFIKTISTCLRRCKKHFKSIVVYIVNRSLLSDCLWHLLSRHQMQMKMGISRKMRRNISWGMTRNGCITLMVCIKQSIDYSYNWHIHVETGTENWSRSSSWSSTWWVQLKCCWQVLWPRLAGFCLILAHFACFSVNASSTMGCSIY